MSCTNEAISTVWYEQTLGAKKRNSKRGREIEDDDADGNEDATHLQQKHQALGTGPSEVSWSCPFWKRDPIHHMDCMSYKLRRIQDVKQHLARKHYEFSIYCPICQHRFVDTKERDHHIRQRKCTERSARRTDTSTTSIPPEKQEQLRARMSGSDREAWYQMWDILFRGETPPATPHQKTVIEEVADFMQEFWREHQSKIILDITHRQRPHDKDTELIRAQLPSLMSSALSRLVERVKGAIHSTELTSPPNDNFGASITGTVSREASSCPFSATPPQRIVDYPGFEDFPPAQKANTGISQSFGAGHDAGFDIGNDDTTDDLQDWDSSLYFPFFGGNGSPYTLATSSTSFHSEGT